MIAIPRLGRRFTDLLQMFKTVNLNELGVVLLPTCFAHRRSVVLTPARRKHNIAVKRYRQSHFG